ncbi:MAG: polysaccharide deacetylase family protein [Acidimicrobiales bacterium]
MSRSRCLAGLVAVVVVTLSSLLEPALTAAPAAAADKPVVYLTFDDGPGSYTPQFLDLLAHHDIRATFFVTGQHTTTDGALARRMVAEGHALGNHSWSHPRLTSLSNAAIAGQFAATNRAIAAATGVVPTCYRPPYGAVDARVHAVAVAVGLPNAEWRTASSGSHWGLWDIDTNDWRLSVAGGTWTEADMRRQLDRVGDGDTVLLHDGGLHRSRGLAVLGRWLAANHDRFDFRPLPGCGGVVSEAPFDPAHPERWHRFQIARLYRAYFDRAPDPDGWDYWNEQFSRGLSPIGISHWFARSSEFALLGERSDTELVTFVYRQILDREPDPDGLTYWVGELARGLDRGALVYYFSESDEFIVRSAPMLTGGCYSGEFGSSYACWAAQLPPAQRW